MPDVLNLSFLMLERVGVIIVLACLLVSIKQFRMILFDHQELSAKLKLVLIFSLFAILANLTGVEIDQNNQIISTGFIFSIPTGFSIANARLLSVTVSGIIGGPYVGAIVGAITGIHRIIQGGWTGWFYVPSSLIIGALAGILAQKKSETINQKTTQPAYGLMIGLAMEAIQMLFILFFSPTNFALVKLIAIPMLLVNSLGTYLFLWIITIILNQEQEAKAVQTHDVLTLANKTLPYLREGLNLNSAQHVAEIIKKYTNFSAISITSTDEVLSYTGAGSDHHLIGGELVTTLSEKVINTNQTSIAHTKKEIGCNNPNCPLNAAIVVPLDVDSEIIGTLKFYFTNGLLLNSIAEELAEGLASIFSSQIALGKVEAQAKLVKEAEIKSLQAQINPHFFFNAMNTISVMIRKDSTKARELLLSLSTYFRANLAGVRDTQITLAKEIEYVNSYLELEQTRFPDKFTVEIDNQVSPDCLIPPFTMQILIENAIKHAFVNRKTGNIVKVEITDKPTVGSIQLKVTDNGQGISGEILSQIGQKNVTSKTGSGTALYNLNQRLTGLYGPQNKLQISSVPEFGTTITLNIPQKGDQIR